MSSDRRPAHLSRERGRWPMKRKVKTPARPVEVNNNKELHSGYATLRQWRRIALERQLPQPRFPSGLGVPSAILLVCLIAIGGCTTVYFLWPPHRTVPPAVVDSQRDLVVEVAHRLSVG